MSDFDLQLIAWSRTTARRLFRRPSASTTTAASSGRAPEAWKTEARKQVVTQFILTLSDQQLVTGLAILVSGIANQSRLTLYEFSVMVGLALFSSTTHLVTLDALRIYLKTHSLIRHVRVVGIVAVLGLLFYAFVVTLRGIGMPRTAPALCVLELRTSDVVFNLYAGALLLVLLFYE